MHFRALFLSDIHLGSPDCQADRLLDFLQHNTCEQLYLVGDIVDFWVLKRHVRWPALHSEVVSQLLAISSNGTRVIYIPGNHDEAVREVHGSFLGGVEISDELVHRTAKGERYLVLHGDIFDDLVLSGSWQHRLGGDLYDLLLAVSRKLSVLRRLLGFPHWSLAAHLKYRFADALQHIEDYEYAALREAAMSQTDGIICGHIHHPNMKTEDDIHYLNCGDWVEHGSAIAETREGDMIQIDWLNDRNSLIQSSLIASTTRRQQHRVQRAA